MNEIIHTLRLEWKLIWSRRSVVFYLLTCFLAFTGTTLLMEQVVVGAEKGWVADVQRNLWLRNWILPLGYVWMGVQSFVEDKEQGFVAESIVRGTPRSTILISKMGSLLGVSILSLLLCIVPMIFYPSSGQQIDTLVGLPLTLLSDIVLIGWVALFGLSKRSTNGVLLRMLLLIGFDFSCRMMLWIGPNLFSSPLLEWLSENIPLLLPSTAFNCWMFWEEAWQIETLAVTVLYAIVVWGTVHLNWKKTIF